jgi:ribonuclease HI
MPWASRLLRGERVFARVASDGAVKPSSDGRVDIVYRPGGKVYRAAARNLSEDPKPELLSDEAAAPAEAASDRSRSAPPAPTPKDAFVIYADGACSGNPGPCGIGVVLLDGASRREISEYLGQGTNNIAELTALLRGLENAPRDRTIVLCSDSAYALGLLGKGWKAKANQELVAELRAVARGFRDLRLVKVEGHSGVAENERADALARDAVIRRM